LNLIIIVMIGKLNYDCDETSQMPNLLFMLVSIDFGYMLTQPETYHIL